MSIIASATELMHAGKADLLLLRRAGCEPVTCVYVPSLSTSLLLLSHPACLIFSEPFSEEVIKQKTMTCKTCCKQKPQLEPKGTGQVASVTGLTLSCFQNCCRDYTNPAKGQPFLHMSTADIPQHQPSRNPKAESLLTRHHASHQYFLNPLPLLTHIKFLLSTAVSLSIHRHQKSQYKPITSVCYMGT